MKRFLKNTALTSLVVLILTFIGGAIFVWPVDPRLNGKFRSNAEETIENMLLTRKLTEKQLGVYSQIFGNMTYEIKGHEIVVVMDEYTVKSRIDGAENTYNESLDEYYFIMVRKGKNKVTVLFLPLCRNSIFDFEIVNIEFSKDGFWVTSQGEDSSSKEKFNRINR